MTSDRPTVPAPPPSPSTASRLSLMVMADDRLDIHALPAAGRVTLGRDAACDVRVDLTSVSRRHAVLVIAGGAAAIEDLGSSNGTHVGGARLAAGTTAAVRFGQIFHLGSVPMVVQQASGAVDAPARGPVVLEPAMRAVHATLAQVAAGASACCCSARPASARRCAPSWSTGCRRAAISR